MTPVTQLTGKTPAEPQFSSLDQHLRLKMRGFVDLFISPLYKEMIRHTTMSDLREAGVFPVVYYIDFESLPVPCNLWPHHLDYTMGLKRISRPHKGLEGDLLVLDIAATLAGRKSSPNPDSLWLSPQAENPEIPKAVARVVQVLTRPLAPPAERSVTRLPDGMRLFEEQPWEGVFPTAEVLSTPPQGVPLTVDHSPPKPDGVWGMADSDPNQHVNVNSYVLGMEDLFSRLVEQGGFSQSDFHIRRLEMVFKKPFFVGDRYSLRGRLYTGERGALLLGDYHTTDRNGQTDPRPAVSLRLTGEPQPGPPP